MEQCQFDGWRGESIALLFLESKGFCFVDRNWRCRLGEIDLIVSRGNEIRFIEVKLRRSKVFGYPEESITKKKLHHLSQAIECWLSQQRRKIFHYQVDAIAIYLPNPHNMDIFWIEAIL